MTPRILFVDQESLLIEPTRQLFSLRHRDWDLAFATGSEEALAVMREKPVDVLISDTDSPDSWGMDLMRQSTVLYPQTFRIFMTGKTGQEELLAAVPSCQRLLTKPCTSEALLSTLESVLSCRSILENPALRAMVGRIKKLPSVPRCYLQLTEMASDPTKDISDAVEIVENDAAMSVRVLQIVNSGCFGHVGEVGSIPDAVMYLGLGLIKGLALITDMFSSIDEHTLTRFSLDRVLAGWLEEARLAKRLLGGGHRGEEAFTVTLVRDLGRLILASEFPEELAVVIAESKQSKIPEHLVEFQHWGTTHAEIGGYLLGVWGIKASIVDAVANHHVPSQSTSAEPEILAVAHVLDTLEQNATNPTGIALENRLDMPFLLRAGVSNQLANWVSKSAKNSI